MYKITTHGYFPTPLEIILHLFNVALIVTLAMSNLLLLCTHAALIHHDIGDPGYKTNLTVLIETSKISLQYLKTDVKRHPFTRKMLRYGFHGIMIPRFLLTSALTACAAEMAGLATVVIPLLVPFAYSQIYI